jgi:hypothetical protein
MGVPRHSSRYLALFALVVCAITASVGRCDEIRLKDGKKLYGVIVAYEDNMFKIKTDFGYVLVEKDKIAAIIPDTPGSTSAAKSGIVEPAKPAAEKKPPKPAAVAKSEISDSGSPASATDAASNEAPKIDPEQVKREKAAAIVGNANARPEIPSGSATNGSATALKSPALKTTSAPAMAPKNALAGNAAPPAPPKEEPSNVEEVQGNQYLNHTYGFRMFKAPSWQLIPAAEQTLPNAIVAMGTNNESTLLVISREKTKLTLDTAAGAMEKRLHDVYENYRLISTRKTTVGGLPAQEYRYRGTADEHDWSGTLVVVSRGPEMFTVLGMTYADSDLIQIQENVIARSIASLDFQAK